MNQYLKIPRGINIIKTNDLIMRKVIEEIGKQYSRVLLGTFRSNYAKGKAYLSQKYGISKTALKKLHKVKMSPYGYSNINEQYGNYISVNIILAKAIFEDIIKCTKEKNIDLLNISVSKYDKQSRCIDALFEESLNCMNRSLRDRDNFNTFNKNLTAHTELRSVYQELNSITELLGG